MRERNLPLLIFCKNPIYLLTEIITYPSSYVSEKVNAVGFSQWVLRFVVSVYYIKQQNPEGNRNPVYWNNENNTHNSFGTLYLPAPVIIKDFRYVVTLFFESFIYNFITILFLNTYVKL